MCNRHAYVCYTLVQNKSAALCEWQARWSLRSRGMGGQKPPGVLGEHDQDVKMDLHQVGLKDLQDREDLHQGTRGATITRETRDNSH